LDRDEPVVPLVRPLTRETLADRCRYWQRRLRLQDWDVTTRIARFDEIEGVGVTSVSSRYRHAEIKILSETDVDRRVAAWPGRCHAVDWEVTLVHELLHLHFHDVGEPKDGTAEEIALERAVDAIAIALVRPPDSAIDATSLDGGPRFA
jgi:hypothetical protein